MCIAWAWSGVQRAVELDLVELVDAQQATGVAPGRPGLAAIATGVGHESHGQLRLVEYLAGDHRRERHLGRGDRPEVIAFEVVRVVAELRKVAGADHRVGLHDRRRTDLLEGIAIAIEAVVDERARDEHRRLGTWRTSNRTSSRRGRHRGCRAVRRPPNGGPLMFGVATRVVVFDAHDDVVVFSEAVGRIWGRHVRNVEQLLAKRSLEFVGLGGERLLSLPEPLLSSCSALASSPLPSRCSAPISFDRALTRLRMSSRSVPTARTLASSSTARSIPEVSSPRRAIAAFTASGSVRSSLMSSMVRRYRPQDPAALVSPGSGPAKLTRRRPANRQRQEFRNDSRQGLRSPTTTEEHHAHHPDHHVGRNPGSHRGGRGRISGGGSDP